MSATPPPSTTMPHPPPPEPQHCPRCGETVQRIHRRFLDHVVSLLRPLRRYRCDNPACQWEGNLRWRRRRQPRC